MKFYNYFYDRQLKYQELPRMCEELGFGKTKSAKIFKKLVELGLADKHGAGAGTYYILKIEGYIGEEEKNKEVGMKVSENGK